VEDHLVDRYEYKCIEADFSADKVLRQVEAHEQDGWTLYSLQPKLMILMGCGGTFGMRAVMRRAPGGDLPTGEQRHN
jgi:hypothetical protein